jgi:hypothetical protein
MELRLDVAQHLVGRGESVVIPLKQGTSPAMAAMNAGAGPETWPTLLGRRPRVPALPAHRNHRRAQ